MIEDALLWVEIADCIALRDAVFFAAMGEHAPEDWMDDLALHVCARDPDTGATLGCGRLVLLDDGAKIDNVAVHADHRHRGIATAIVLRLVALAAESGLPRVTLTARLAVAPLYARCGFAPVGAVFALHDTPHQVMVREIEKCDNA